MGPQDMKYPWRSQTPQFFSETCWSFRQKNVHIQFDGFSKIIGRRRVFPIRILCRIYRVNCERKQTPHAVIVGHFYDKIFNLCSWLPKKAVPEYNECNESWKAKVSLFQK